MSLAIARRLRQLGLSVIPIPPASPDVPPGHPGDGKVTEIPWRRYQTRPATEAKIITWFSGRAMNIGIVTGAVSGVIVVDVDSGDAARWWVQHRPFTPWQVQTARGWHFYYAHPGVRVPNRAHLETRDGRLAIDVRGDGGYVIAPGSIHASGVAYVEVGDWTVPCDQLPRFWPGWLQRRPSRSSPRPPSPYPTGTDVARARRYLAAIPRPEIGHGSDNRTLYAACRLVRGFGLSAADAELLLWDWAGHRRGWTRDWIACKVAHAERYGTEPIGSYR